MRRLLIIGGVIAVVLAAVVSFYASPQPDGLERVATDQGFSGAAQDSAVAGSPLADYTVSGVRDERLGNAVAGLAGLAVTAVVGFGLFHLLTRRPD